MGKAAPTNTYIHTYKLDITKVTVHILFSEHTTVSSLESGYTNYREFT
jgi:hypothetical protein